MSGIVNQPSGGRFRREHLDQPSISGPQKLAHNGWKERTVRRVGGGVGREFSPVALHCHTLFTSSERKFPRDLSANVVVVGGVDPRVRSYAATVKQGAGA
jgi:hypothetical protein